MFPMKNQLDEVKREIEQSISKNVYSHYVYARDGADYINPENINCIRQMVASAIHEAFDIFFNRLYTNDDFEKDLNLK